MKRILRTALCIKPVYTGHGITVFHEFQLVKCWDHDPSEDPRLSRKDVEYIAVKIRREDYKNIIKSWQKVVGKLGRHDGTWVFCTDPEVARLHPFEEHFIILGDEACLSTNTDAQPAAPSSNS